MMIGGRSYQYTTQRKEYEVYKSDVTSSRSPSQISGGFGWRPANYDEEMAHVKRSDIGLKKKSSPKTKKSERTDDLPIEPLIISKQALQRSSTDHSQPVMIPRREPLQNRNLAATRRAGPPAHSNVVAQYNMTGIQRPVPPQVIDILANTSFTPRKTFPRRFQRMSSEELVEHWRQLELEDDTPTDPNMEILLSPPQTEGALQHVEGYESLVPKSLPVSRSSSSDSIPSLDADENSVLSWTMPDTPDHRIRRTNSGVGIKERLLSSLPSVECDDDHPLLVDSSVDTAILHTSTPASRSPISARLPLKRPTARTQAGRQILPRSSSALSTSLKVLRNAARSFSNFAAPSLTVLPDDHLSRGLFGHSGKDPAWPAEMRPTPMAGMPTAAMRRYMNPVHGTIPGDFHVHGASWDNLDLEAVASASIPVIDQNGFVDPTGPPAVIRLHNYIKMPSVKTRRRMGRLANKPLPMIKPTATEQFVHNLVQEVSNRPRREPRENADFLRVCVLEMNMRRAGKLENVGIGAVGAGRARYWLPPRVDGCADEDTLWKEMDTVALDGRRVPKRWIGIVVQ